MRDPLPRRRKLGDPFAAPSKIRSLLDQLLQRLAANLSDSLTTDQLRANDYQLLIQLLQKASHYIRTGENTTARASKKFPIPLLSLVIAELSNLLTVESQNRISFRTFTDNNLRVLDCPDDIKTWLESGQITLFEALQLKRLHAEAIDASEEQAQLRRQEFLRRYQQERWLAHRLRHEIDAHLGKQPETSQPIKEIPLSLPVEAEPSKNSIPELTQLKVSQNSIFGEQITLMIELLQTFDPTEISNDEMEQLLTNIDNVLLQLQYLSRKKISKPGQDEPSHNLGFC